MRGRFAVMTHAMDDMQADRRHEFGFARAMGWLIFLLRLFWPRLFILGFWIFSDLLGRAYSTAVIPVVGFFLAPWTTLVYAMCWGRSSDRVFGWEGAVVALAVVLDVATHA